MFLKSPHVPIFNLLRPNFVEKINHEYKKNFSYYKLTRSHAHDYKSFMSYLLNFADFTSNQPHVHRKDLW